MTTQVTPESIKQFFEQAAKAYGDAWKSQAEYYDGLVRRNTNVLTEIADARIASYREMSEAKTFNQAFEANLAFEEKVREDLTRLQEKNTESWQHLVDELKAIYTPAEKAAKPKAAPKTKAPKAKAAASKTTKTAKAA
jgi:lysozyme family protein